MQIFFTKRFWKQYYKLSKSVQRRFKDRVKLFTVDPLHPVLRVHPLRGKYAGYWSMNVSGDVRALYRTEGKTMVVFALIGTHSELYG